MSDSETPIVKYGPPILEFSMFVIACTISVVALEMGWLDYIPKIIGDALAMVFVVFVLAVHLHPLFIKREKIGD